MKNIKIYLLTFLIIVFPFNANSTGIPTVDIVGNIRGALQLVEDTLNTIETQVQSAQQLNQIRNEVTMIANQVSQAARELRNLENLGGFNFTETSAQLRILNRAENRAGSLAFGTNVLKENYDLYRDSQYYQDNSDTIDQEVFANARKRWNDNQLNTAKASASVLSEQSDLIESDANRLDDLNNTVKGIDGAVQAQQAGNQLQSFTSAQLLHLRTLMLNEQQIEIQRSAQEAEKNAIQDAYFEKATQYTLDRSTHQEF